MLFELDQQFPHRGFGPCGSGLYWLSPRSVAGELQGPVFNAAWDEKMLAVDFFNGIGR